MNPSTLWAILGGSTCLLAACLVSVLAWAHRAPIHDDLDQAVRIGNSWGES